MTEDQLILEAKACGFADPKPLLTLAGLKPWALAQGFDAPFFGRTPGKSSRHRVLIIHAPRHIYRVQLEPNPLLVRLDVVEPGPIGSLGWSGTTLGWSTSPFDTESWTTIKMRIMAAEAGKPMAL